MPEWTVKLTDKIERTSDITSFRFEAPESLFYLPGQFFFIYIPAEVEGSIMHHFSFCKKRYARHQVSRTFSSTPPSCFRKKAEGPAPKKTLCCTPFLVREISRLMGAGLPKTGFHSMKFIGLMTCSLNFF